MLQFTTNEQGGADVDVPVLRPTAPTVSAPGTIAKNKAKVTGTGIAGRTIYLYAGTTQIGSTTVNGSGNFVVVATTLLKSGTYALSITQADEKNAESDNVDAGSVTVPPALTVSSTVLAGNVATVEGTGQAGLTVKVGFPMRNLRGLNLLHPTDHYPLVSFHTFA